MARAQAKLKTGIKKQNILTKKPRTVWIAVLTYMQLIELRFYIPLDTI